MSSTSNTAKQPPEGASSEEPSQKKAKITGDAKNDESKSSLDANNGTDIPEDNVGAKTSRIPTKAANGKDKCDDDGVGDEAEGANLDGVFDPKIANTLEQAESIQNEICTLNEKASEEILKVEQKFNKLRRPHFEKRNELLKEVPNFWLTSLANHQIIAPMIESAEDEDCLHYMVNLDIEEYEDIKSGYRLKLHFVENPYITNEVIVKEINMMSDDIHASSTPIEYKNTPQGKSLKQVVENSTAQLRRSRRPGQTQQSFFAWLVEPSREAGPDDIADILKDQIYQNPLGFFFATPEDYEAGTDDESDDEDEEIDDEDIDDEEEHIITEGGVDFSDEELDGEDEEEDEEENDEEDVE